MTLTSLKNTEIYIPEAYIISCEQKWPCVTGVDLYNNSKLGFWCIKIHSDSIFWSHFFFASFGNFFFVFLYSVLLVFITIFFFPLFFLLHISWGKGGEGNSWERIKDQRITSNFTERFTSISVYILRRFALPHYSGANGRGKGSGRCLRCELGMPCKSSMECLGMSTAYKGMGAYEIISNLATNMHIFCRFSLQ